ncbi:type II toxin-antitoxin system HipA family toxin [Azohydromonas caseinilytica]|uniref:Type II toxin-antitoxin system HipA family toxin n=1 Tax=Azohydromonas caseinilytica TaxID=2728836 RepID=A0A848F304_9BURK|nr:type II toxin-antitoxin system HipA family toxin [Azohydromonas caseinilytica]NML13418.1 type II toxin-antitoxin system HipA family toxin [Azohydromonas caseinilytica]
MPTNVLHVFLNDVQVGILSRNTDDSCEFKLLDSYKTLYPRPVLGQRFLDDLDRVWRVRSRVPDWFSNLLPEGALRALVARQAEVRPEREFFLLCHLGQDLPGAVRLFPEQAELQLADEGATDESTMTEGDTDWHFSLAGVQLKFSAQQGGRGLTIPVTGQGGDWIIKLPDSRYAGVPENEFATMQWAHESGIEVPETKLLSIDDISGLPPQALALRERQVYAIRRFDRQDDGRRVHMEDFAQILGLYPEAKYKQFNYETIANVVKVLTGEDGLRDFIRRLVFVIASGNGDAHHKNWSLIYPDGVSTRLSPAYDLVSTIQYMEGDQLALNLGGSKRWQDVSMATFTRMARKLKLPENLIEPWVEEAVEAILSTWSCSKVEYGYPSAAVERIERHIAQVPLFKRP